MSGATVVVAGATGHIGTYIVKAFLDHAKAHSDEISTVIALTRNADSALAQELKSLGAELASGIDGRKIDIGVNTLGFGADNDGFALGCKRAGAKVYFPPDFGMNYRAQNHQAFDDKIRHDKYARDIGGDQMKVIALATGQWIRYTFLDLGPAVGLDTKHKVFSAPGNVDNKVTFTAMEEVGLVTVRLSLLALKDRNSVPDFPHICGDAKSWREIAAIVSRARGVDTKVEAIAMDEYMAKILPTIQPPFVGYLRLFWAKDCNDMSDDNSNELVNPDEKYWKWTSLNDWITSHINELP